MKKHLSLLLIALVATCIAWAQSNNPSPAQPTSTKPYTINTPKGTKTYTVADHTDSMKLYSMPSNKANCYLVVSKSDYRLYVYEKTAQGLTLCAHYPICYAKNTGPKERTGDMKTPESIGNTPFEISQMADASTWGHDFKDGRGYLKQAYGKWFLRLKLNGTPLVGNRSIGIHGSTNNAVSVPGRDSEGCIRLRDADIIHLHDTFARIGTKVFIRSITQGKTPAEAAAVAALGKKYCAPKPGSALLK